MPRNPLLPMSKVTITYPSSPEMSASFQGATPLPDTNEHDAIVLKVLETDAQTVAEINGNSQATLYINFTKGNSTKVQIRFYGSYLKSPTASDWFQEVVETDTTGVAALDKFIIELTASTQIAYHLPIGAYQTFKVTYQAVGADLTNSTLFLKLGLRTN